MTHKQQLIDWARLTLREAAWAPLSVICFYAVGLAFHLYDRFPPLDIPSHILGGIAITYFYRAAIRNSQSIVGDIPTLIQTLLAFTSAGTTIILWEFYETALDFFFDALVFRSLDDTIRDMFLGLMGALAFSLLQRRR